MQYLLVTDSGSSTIQKITIAGDTFKFNNIACSELPDYKNFGSEITVLSAKSFELDSKLTYGEKQLVINVGKKAHEASYFSKLKDIIKPESIKVKYLKNKNDTLLFFEAQDDIEYFMHSYLSARFVVFNDKNDKFNCTIYGATREAYLTHINTITIDVLSSAYFELECEATVTVTKLDTEDYVVPIKLRLDEKREYEDIVNVLTDTYTLTFPSKGTYTIIVKNKNNYPCKNFLRVQVL